MKQVFIDFGHCSTCGEPLYAVVDEVEFIGPEGQDLDSVRVEAHCGVGGHNLVAGRVTREEFEAANDGDTI